MKRSEAGEVRKRLQENLLIRLMVERIVGDEEAALNGQMTEILRSLLDTDTMEGYSVCGRFCVTSFGRAVRLCLSGQKGESVIDKFFRCCHEARGQLKYAICLTCCSVYFFLQDILLWHASIWQATRHTRANDTLLHAPICR